MRSQLLILIFGVLGAISEGQTLRGDASRQDGIRDKVSSLAQKIGLSSKVQQETLPVETLPTSDTMSNDQGSMTKMDALQTQIGSRVEDLPWEDLMKFTDIVPELAKMKRPQGVQEPMTPPKSPFDVPMQQQPQPNMPFQDQGFDKFADVRGRMKTPPQGDNGKGSDGRRLQLDYNLDGFPDAVGLGAAGVGVADVGLAGLGVADVGVAGLGVAGVGVAGVGVAGVGVAGVGVAGGVDPFYEYNVGLPQSVRYYGGCYQRYVANRWGCMNTNALGSIFSIPSGVVFYNGHWCRRRANSLVIITTAGGRCWRPPLLAAASFASPYGVQTVQSTAYGGYPYGYGAYGYPYGYGNYGYGGYALSEAEAEK